MVTNEERREVAEKLRGYDVSSFAESPIAAMLDCLGIGYTGWRDMLNELADLIDRPACRNKSGYRDIFSCSECGVRVECVSECGNDEGDMFNVPLMPSFCPNCGAEVVE